MKGLNKKYRKVDKVTDILSFESYEKNVLGELVFCPEFIEQQAKKHGLSFYEEFSYLILHGILHLLGYDHETDEKEAERMFSLQDKLFDEFLDSQ